MIGIEEYRSEFKRALLELNRLEASSIIDKVKEYDDKDGFIENILVPVFEEIGEGWETGEVALSQIYISGRICEELVERMFPYAKDELESTPDIAIVTYDDYHPLGKKIVFSTLKASGVNLLDYGHGLSEDELIELVEEDNIEILIISVLMLDSALKVSNVIEKLKASNPGLKCLVGGAPFRFDADLWKEVGADAFAITPKDTLNIIRKWKEQSVC